MQRSNEQMDPAAKSTSDKINKVANDMDSTSSYVSGQTNATAMRSGIQNPSESNYQVAGPVTGGAPMPYDSAKIEQAKKDLVDPMKGMNMSSKNSTGIAGQTAQSSKNSAVAGTTNAATGAAAGSATVNYGKNLVSRDGQSMGTHGMESPHPHPIAQMPNSMSSGQQNITRSQPASVPTHDNNMPSMKGHPVSTAAVMGATSAAFPAPPMNDTVSSTTYIPPTAPGQASEHSWAHQTTHNTPAVTMPNYKDKSINKASVEVEHEHEHKERRPSIAEKVKNIFHRRSSGVDAEKDTMHGADNAHSSSSSSNAAEAAAGTTAVSAIAARTGDANMNMNNLAHDELAYPEHSHLTSSGGPKADLSTSAAAPTLTNSNVGMNNRMDSKMATTVPSANMGLSDYTDPTVNMHSSTNTSRPMTEKGAGAVAATGAYMGAKAMGHKESEKESVNNTTSPWSKTVPSMNTTASSAYTPPSTNINSSTYTSPSVNLNSSMPTNTTRPMMEKNSGAAAATGAYVGAKAKESTNNKSTSVTTPTNTFNSGHANNVPSGNVVSLGANDVASSGANATATSAPVAKPVAYKGPVPNVAPGEEVVWVKTVTTTEYHDSENGKDAKGDVVEMHQDVINPSQYQSVKAGETEFKNDQQANSGRGPHEEMRGGGGRRM